VTATPDSQIDHLWHLYGQVDQQKFQQGYFKAWVEGAVQTGLNTVWVMNHMGGKCDPENQGPGDEYPEYGPISLDD
jgi:hypothetical protein